MRWLCGLFLLWGVLSPVTAQPEQVFSQTQLDAIFLVGEDQVRALYNDYAPILTIIAETLRVTVAP